MDIMDEVHLGSPLPEGEKTVSIMVTPAGQTVIAPRSIRALKGAALEIAARLQALADLQDRTRAEILALCAEGRDEGMSYAAIGWCIGVGPERVRQIVRDQT